MYCYTEADQTHVDQRVAEFGIQTQRYLEGKLTEDEFRPLRLMNGLYIQRHAPMLRVAIPYGHLSSTQLYTLADIAQHYDKNYGHFTTRQNIQFNWPKLEKVPEILALLAKVQMHAIQTSGNCVRNTTTDALAGVAADEVLDPSPYCEIIRQYSSAHPEFAYLPRKFKIAVCASQEDRAAILVHDIGLHIKKDEQGQIVFDVYVGGGLGRTPMLGEKIRHNLAEADLLSYIDAVLRIYNLLGRRDNKYKARIKILVKALTAQSFAKLVEEEWLEIKDSHLKLTQTEIEAMKGRFTYPELQSTPQQDIEQLKDKHKDQPEFLRWLKHNVKAHRHPNYRAVMISLKRVGKAPGDATGEEMRAIAKLADTFSFGEIRVAHEQNLVLPNVAINDLYTLWVELNKALLATPNIKFLTDIIACPGGDFCSLANAKSLPVAQAIMEKFDHIDFLYDLGPIELNISGCINACAHHHIGHIGILGVDKNGQDFFQITLGGKQGFNANIGKVIGPSVSQDEVPNIIDKILGIYLAQREEGELFVDSVARLGIPYFKEQVYANLH
ncbi:nitrite/sulfite reductase [Neisseria sp. Ec49-e6-T10]|uniref:nitrite/sulfite reductase n=1 Tax=Neisseria sp. Ec49-e6-T10 TaxID=3140744 RepID=UPI003EBFD9A9